jgi:predicted ester cyclase
MGSDTLAIAKDYAEGFLGRGDPSIADKVLSPQIEVITGLNPTGPIVGLETYKQIFLDFFHKFPEVSPLKIIDAFAAGDRAVIRFYSLRRHAHDYFGVAATGREILFDETHVMRIEGGKVVETVVPATNLEFEMLMAPAVTPLILK